MSAPVLPAPTAAAIHDALREVYDPCSQAWQRPLSVRDLGLIRHVVLDGRGQVTIRISLTAPFCTALATIMKAIEARVGEVPGVLGVTVDIDAVTEWSPALMTSAGRAALAARRANDRALAELTAPAEPTAPADPTAPAVLHAPAARE